MNSYTSFTLPLPYLNGEEMAEHLLLSCPRWAVERQRHFSDGTDIKDIIRNWFLLAGTVCQCFFYK